MKTHSLRKTFKCDQCNKDFVLEWRLEKHKLMHEPNNSKFCHYYNNKKACPYEECGCMYKLEHSRPCKYQQKCSNKLCQFKHSDTKEYSCNYCDFKAKLKDVFDEHTVNHNVEEIKSNEDIADQSLDFEKDLDYEKYFDESYPD